MSIVRQHPASSSTDALQRIGLAVRRARRAVGLSQRALSALSGVDQGSISRIENGLAPRALLDYLGRIVAVLGPIGIGAWARVHLDDDLDRLLRDPIARITLEDAMESRPDEQSA